jgi:hypothetical protein
LFCAWEGNNPEKVYSVVYVQKPAKWYLEQADLWQREIKKNNQNAEAWRNYYAAVRYHRYTETIGTPEKKAKLKQIIDDMEKAIPDSYEYHFLKYKNEGSLQDISHLKKAYQLRPNEPEIFSDFVSYYDFTGDDKEKNRFLQKWYDSRDIATGLINYNYNVLMSTEKNSVLFTNGDNDTYPIWMLQSVQKVRPDVTILNVSLSMAKQEYLERKLKEKGITLDFDALPKYRSKDFIAALGKYICDNYPEVSVYYALTVWDHYTASIKDNLYIIGLAYKYSSQRIDNVALIKKNLQSFRMDYLGHDWYSEDFLATSIMPRLNLNYLPSIVTLVKHYYASGNLSESQNWAEVARHLAKIAGIEEKLIKDLEKEGISM